MDASNVKAEVSDGKVELTGNVSSYSARNAAVTAAWGINGVKKVTLTGTVILTIPGGTQNGRRFRLRGKGLPHLRQPEQHGGLYAETDVRLPEDLAPHERELFEELQQFSEEQAR